MTGISEVHTYNGQPVQVQYDNQKVLDGEETKHLVKNAEVGHDSKSDHQKRSIMDKQGLHDIPYVRAVFNAEGHFVVTFLPLTFWVVVHHY